MLSEKLTNIIEKERDIIPFLKKLNVKQKKELVPTIKMLNEKHQRREYNKHSKIFECISSDKQRSLINKAKFVCFDKTDYKKHGWLNHVFSENFIEEILPWYVPKWFGDLLNEEKPWVMDYNAMMNLYHKSLLNPSNGLIAYKLSSAIIKFNNNGPNTYVPENLEIHKETLKDHIWTLFTQEEAKLHNEHRNRRGDIWIRTIKNLIKNDRIDRQKVISHILMTSTYNFNKLQIGWFCDLLVALNPSISEVIEHQNDFFVCLNSATSRVVNTALKYLKLVANNEKLDSTQFINISSLLLTSEVKSVVNSTLVILDKIAKSRKKEQGGICVKTTEAFINQDEKIQLRAATIINSYGSNNDEVLIDAVNQYAGQLLFAPKELLQDFISINKVDIDETDTDEIYEEVQFISDENLLEKYETFDELIFLISQIIEDKEDYHLDFLLSYLPKLNLLINEENVLKLEPIFKRIWNVDRHGRIKLRGIGAYYLDDYMMLLMEKYPKLASNLYKYFDDIIKKANRFVTRYENYDEFVDKNLVELEMRPVRDYFFSIYRDLALKSKEMIKNGISLPLLSTPTHAPFWLDPEEFIERIVAYEKNNVEIDLYDLQIAQFRLPLNYQSKKIARKISKIQSEDLKSSLKYLYNNKSLNINLIEDHTIWIAPILSKNNDEDIDRFKSKFKIPLIKGTSEFSYFCEHFPEKWEESIIKIHGPFEKADDYRIDSIFTNCILEPTHYLNLKKCLLLAPNYPTVFITQLLYGIRSSEYGEYSNRSIINTLKFLIETWHKRSYNEIIYLFVAVGFLYSRAIVREITAELWINANNQQAMDNELLGRTLGKLQFGEFSPLKRFIDVVVKNIFNTTKRLDKALLILIDNMISEMNDKPIRNCKKILEIMLELKMKNLDYKMLKATETKLKSWEKTKSLKPIIRKLV